MTEKEYLNSKGIKDNPRIIDASGQATDFYLQDLLKDYKEQLLIQRVVPEGMLCDLDGEKVVVKFKVTKHIPKIFIENT